MSKTNWIILSSNGVGKEYGVGTYIKLLSYGLSQYTEIKVYVIEIAFPQYSVFKIRESENITYIETPPPDSTSGLNTQRNQIRIAKSFFKVVNQYISPGDRTIIHMNYTFQYFIAREFKEKLNGKVLFTQHIYPKTQTTKTDLPNIDNATYELADRIITVAREGKTLLINQSVPEDKLKTIYNGINPGWFTVKSEIDILEKYGLNKNEKLVLFCGRIDPIKGLKYLISAFKLLLERCPDSRLIIAGNGDFDFLIEVSKSISGNISFLGFVPFEDIVELYRVADIGVIPSLEEPCGYVALEMLYCGLPIVATKIGGLKEILTHKENALLTDVISDGSSPSGMAPKIDQMADQMFQLLTCEKTRSEYSKNAVIRATRNFTLDQMTSQYLQTFKNLN